MMIKAMDDRQCAVFAAGLLKAPPRDRALLLLMLHAGLRNGEVRALKFGDVFNGSTVFQSLAVANGHISRGLRYIPISTALNNALTAHHLSVRSALLPCDHSSLLFISRIQKKQLNARDIQRITLKWTQAILGERFHPHSLRHTFATQLLKKSNLRVVQQLLGHQSIKSTEVYTHPSSDDRQDAISSTFNHSE